MTHRLATGWSLADLDVTEITKTLEESIRRGRADDPGTRDPAEMLRGFGLMKDGQILRAAMVLFGRAERIEAELSQGLLHFGLTPEALYLPHESLPWNPLIARVFYRRGIIEAWGRGTIRMGGTDGARWSGQPGDFGGKRLRDGAVQPHALCFAATGRAECDGAAAAGAAVFERIRCWICAPGSA